MNTNASEDQKEAVNTVTVINHGSGYAGEPGGSISIYREKQLDKIAEQIWIARNPSHGDWEYASCKEVYLNAARKAVSIANEALK